MASLAFSCAAPQNHESAKIRLITLDPGHFHAALVQKSMYPEIDSAVAVYAPKGPDVAEHLKKIDQYNHRPEKPTHWKEDVYSGDDFFEKMLAEKKGNVIVMAGNNRKKTEYIKESIDGGFNVLADKPMAIDAANFELLKNSFATASQKKLLLYDIMTERYEIPTVLQRELSMLPKVFGTLQKGTPEKPAVEMESVHFFYKKVSGNVLTRPGWFMDISQQGEGMVDVATHLVDLVQWECLPEKTLDYQKDIQVNTARRWQSTMTLSQFKAITKLPAFPDYLKNDVQDTVLKVFMNGEMNYRICGIYAKVTAKWDYKAPEGSGDTHHSVMRGTRATLTILQGAEQGFKPTLYIEPADAKDSRFASDLENEFKGIQTKYPGVTLKKQSGNWQVIIPEKYNDGHEAHFAKVTEKFISYLTKGDIPKWEVPNMIAKYYTTTRALELAKK